MKYIIGTGWWCNETSNINQLDARKTIGSDEIRGQSFHELWYESIKQVATPEKIVMIDSCSPTKPPNIEEKKDIVHIELNENGGHVTNMQGKYCGWTRSVLLGLEYASLCDCDYFVYVEQDVLLSGEGIVEHCISSFNEKTNYMFGREVERPQPLQQSFFIVKKEGIDSFVSNLRRIKQGDSKIAPEVRFAMAATPFLMILPRFLFYKRKGVLGKILMRLRVYLCRMAGRYAYLPIGYGRERPINFEDKHYYFQHGTKDELEKYKQGFSVDA